MKHPAELAMRYRDGRPYVGYLKLTAEARPKSHHHRKVSDDLIVDFDRFGHPLGVEILFPQRATWKRLNRVLEDLGLRPLAKRWARPLSAA